jgi:hypothetical protein
VRLIFGPFQPSLKEQDSTRKNILTVPSKKSSRVKNEQYQQKGTVVNGKEQYIFFILVKHKHQQ